MISRKTVAALIAVSVFSAGIAVPPAAHASLGSDKQAYYAASIEEYAQYEYSDQQYIPDDEFFGTWDGNSWIKAPYFAYDSWPAMSEIEAAAKTGNYELCKEELLTYYRARFALYKYSHNVPLTLSGGYIAMCEAAFDNFHVTYQNSISGRLYLDETGGWASMDMLADVKGIQQTVGKTVLFQVAASKKDGYTGVIDTRESDYPPYVEVEVNGNLRKYFAVADTYINGGVKGVNYGTEDKLLIEESVSSIGSGTTVDEYTKRGFLQFDFNDIGTADIITQATLYVHGRMVQSDCPAGIRIPSTEKSIYMLPFIRTQRLDETGMTYAVYDTYTDDFHSYDGEEAVRFLNPSEGVIADPWVIEIDQYTEYLTRGYVALKDEAFAYHTIRIMLSLIKLLGDYEHYVRLHETNPGLSFHFYTACKGYTLPVHIHRVIQSQYMTPDALTAILKHIWMSQTFLVEHWGRDEESNNFGTLSVKGLSVAALHFQEFADCTKPVTEIKNPNMPGSMQGGWIPVSSFRRAYKIDDDFYPDGASVELSAEYAIEILENTLDICRVAKLVGYDGTGLFTDEMLQRMEAVATFIMNHLTPWFGDWQFDDGAPYMTNHPSRWAHLNDLINNPYLLWATTKRRRGEKPPYTSCANDTVSKATLRSSWYDDAVASHIEADGGVGSHGHNDDLSITLAAYGKYLLVDPLMGLYDTAEPQERWVSSTRGHNTIEINDTIGLGAKSYTSNVDDYFGETMIVPILQRNTRRGYLYPENREFNDVYDFIRGETFAYTEHNAMTDDFKILRDTLFLKSGYFIVTDYLEPKTKMQTNKYKQLWHFLPEAGITVDEGSINARTNFDGEANLVIAAVDGGDGLEPHIKDGLYAYRKSDFAIAKYLTYEKYTSGTATFNTILYPTPAGRRKEIRTDKISMDVPDDVANAFSAVIKDTDSGAKQSIGYYTLFDEESRTQRSFGEYSTDGVLAFAEKTYNEHSTAILRRGTNLKSNESGKYLIYSKNEIADLGVEWKERKIVLETSKIEGDGALNLSGLTILADKSIISVTLNGENIGYSQKGSYVYFGGSPIIEDDTPTPKPCDKTPVSHAASGGSYGGNGKAAEQTTETAPKERPADAFEHELNGHWGKNEISYLIDAGIVKGVNEASLGLAHNVTRAEFLAMLIRALGIELEKYEGGFGDVCAKDWYAGYIATACANGWLEGDGVNAFPNEPITREQMAKILSCAYEYRFGVINAPPGSLNFSDIDDINGWALGYVEKAVFSGLIQGMETGEFRPKDRVKRKQAMVVVYRMIKSGTDGD